MGKRSYHVRTLKETPSRSSMSIRNLICERRKPIIPRRYRRFREMKEGPRIHLSQFRLRQAGFGERHGDFDPMNSWWRLDGIYKIHRTYRKRWWRSGAAGFRCCLRGRWDAKRPCHANRLHKHFIRSSLFSKSRFPHDAGDCSIGQACCRSNVRFRNATDSCAVSVPSRL